MVMAAEQLKLVTAPFASETLDRVVVPISLFIPIMHWVAVSSVQNEMLLPGTGYVVHAVAPIPLQGFPGRPGTPKES
jgi:hypothetical protein